MKTYLTRILFAAALVLAAQSTVTAQPALSCYLDTIRIVADYNSQSYVPMPFIMNVPVYNTGNDTAHSVAGTISFQPDLQLSGQDASGRYTKTVTPSAIAPGDTGFVSWALSHPISSVDTTYIVSVMFVDAEGDTSYCETAVIVPAFKYPLLRLECVTPTTIVFDESIGEYVPNPFNVTMTIVNAGNGVADSVGGYLKLPDGIVLDPPGQDLHFDMGSLDPWKPGDPIPSKTWTVRWTKRLARDTVPQFCWSAGGTARDAGMRLDSVHSCCITGVPGVRPVYACTLRLPDSLRLNAAGSGVEPNPITAYYTIKNIGSNTGRVQQAMIFFPNDGIALDPSVPGNDQTQTGYITLAPGDSTVYEWVFVISGRLTPRNFKIQAIGLDEEQNPLSCERYIYIPALHPSLSCRIHSSVTYMDYDAVHNVYADTLLRVEGLLTNEGAQALTNLSAEIAMTGDTEYLEFSQGAFNNTNPKLSGTIPSGISRIFPWEYRLAKENTTGRIKTVTICVNYKTDEVQLIENECCLVVQIAPVLSTSVGGTPEVPAFTLGKNYPNPFSSVTDIPYTLDREAEVTISVYSILGKQVATVVQGRKPAGAHTAQWNAQGLPGGVYIVRMNTEGHTESRIMQLQR